MIGMCIYEGNRGLGPCEGAVSRLTVANKRSIAWKGLSELAERLKEGGEQPGVCKAHEARAAANGYVLAPDESATPKAPTGARKVRSAAKPAPRAAKPAAPASD
jgi:hypothetical protein